MSHLLEDLKRFLNSAPTSWHAAKEIGNRLAGLDFTPLDENEKWEVGLGKKYFIQRGGSLCAFSIPQSRPSRLIAIASHTDSPALKIKPKPEVQEENMVLLETELYGSPILTSWLNRDLAIAGRIIIQNNKNEIEEHLIFLDESPVFIPELALHLNRDANDKGMPLDKQQHLRPVISLDRNKKTTLENLLKRQLAFETLLSFDLFLVPIESARFLGTEGEMIGSYRLDNLASAHACAVAMASTPVGNALQMALFWDHEEVGSRTMEGAASPFFPDTIRRIGYALEMSEEEMLRLKNNAFCTSVDVSHAFNPNFPQKYDPKHQPLMGEGIVLKYNADRRYASDAKSAALAVLACKALKLPYQSFVFRSDILGGTTVGPIVASGLGIPTVDIGIPIFSMHSSREVMACQDHLDMCQLLTYLLKL